MTNEARSDADERAEAAWETYSRQQKTGSNFPILTRHDGFLLGFKAALAQRDEDAAQVALLRDCASMLRRADGINHVAKRCASKLNAEMIHRHTIPRWAELEWLVDNREVMHQFTADVRALCDRLEAARAQTAKESNP